MGLVNSMINQIGREIGKDIYKNIKLDIKKSPSNYNFEKELSEFKLASYDRVTIRKLINLVEQSDNINSRGFNNWESCYLGLDDKIDFCKQHLDPSHLSKLEELDGINRVNYIIAKERHKTFVKKEIENFNIEVKKYDESNILVPIILSFFGFNSIFYKSGWGFWQIVGILTSFGLIYNGLTKPSSESINSVHVAFIGLGIYSLVLLASFIRIRKEFNRIKNIRKVIIPSLEDYYSSNFS